MDIEHDTKDTRTMTNTTTKAQTSTLSRSQARKWTLCAQLASAAFVLGAVAIGVVGLPEYKKSTTIDAAANTPGGMMMNGSGAQPGTQPSAEQQEELRTDVDTIGLALRLALLDNAPVLEVISEPEEVSNTDESEITTEDPTGSIIKRVRYIGFINDPANDHAFIRIDGKQRVVTKGGVARAGNDSMPDLRVEQITSRAIILSDGEIRSRVPIADRTGQSVTMAGGGTVEVAAAAENGSLLTDEDEARIAAMPARQQPLARRRLERERRGLSPDKERRRPIPEPQVTVKTTFNKSNND